MEEQAPAVNQSGTEGGSHANARGLIRDAALDLLPIAAYRCEAPSGRITHYNRHAAELWGREPAAGKDGERFCGAHRIFLGDGAPLPRERTPMARVLAGEPTDRASARSIDEHVPYDVEYRTVAPDGAVRWVRAIGRVFCDADGAPKRFDGVTVDVTSQKQVEDALKRADRRKDEFLAGMSHEIRSPMKRLRAFDLCAKTKFIALTGYEEHDVARNNPEIDFDHFVRKPVDAAYLEALFFSKDSD